MAEANTGIMDWVSIIESRAAADPAKQAFLFLDGNGLETDKRTYAELSKRARAVAALLRKRGCAAGAVLLFYPQGLDFVDGFFGTMYAGGVPVPAFSPNAHRTNVHRLEAIIRDSGAEYILTDTVSAGIIRTWAEDSAPIKGLNVIETNRIATEEGSVWEQPVLGPSDTAFLQYTSGSTGLPKGVMVSQGNLLANAALLQGFYGADADSVFLMWVPIYHDLGLIGNVFFSLYLGARCVMMAPESFVRWPLLWLRSIQAYRATISFAPNFAYDLASRHSGKSEADGLDLSSWKTAVIGAEPIYHGTIERFVKAYGSKGFDRARFQCAYGLAESTLMVVTTGRAEGVRCLMADSRALENGNFKESHSSSPRDFRALVSSGKAGAGHSVAIIDPATARPLGENRVGEILLNGPSITQGYYKNSAQTAAVFGIRIGDEEGFLRTGDLGFLHGGELYVTGRSKDLLIINGANHYPQDIEQTAYSSHAGLRPGCAAAFSIVHEDSERVVITAEARIPEGGIPDPGEIFAGISRAVREVHGLGLHEIVLIKPSTLSKTSSGKIQRQTMKRRYLDGHLAIAARSLKPLPDPGSLPGPVHLQNAIHYAIAKASGLPLMQLPLDRHITQLGLDSVKIVGLLGELSREHSIPEAGLKPWEYDTVQAWIVSLGQSASQPSRAEA